MNEMSGLAPSRNTLEVIPEEEEKIMKSPEDNELQSQKISNKLSPIKKNQQNNDKSLTENGDISMISMNFKNTPSFSRNPMINFYENTSEDLSMLKDMASDRSQ